MLFFSWQYTESKKQNEADAADMDGFDADEEDDEEVDSDKEMGLDDEEDGDEVSSLHLQKLAAEVCFAICTYPVIVIVIFFVHVQTPDCSEMIDIVEDVFSNPGTRLFDVFDDAG